MVLEYLRVSTAKCGEHCGEKKRKKCELEEGVMGFCVDFLALIYFFGIKLRVIIGGVSVKKLNCDLLM
jgi:hypothetical protein